MKDFNQLPQSPVSSLFRLSRPGNLLIIGCTMYALRWLVMKPMADSQSIGIEFQLSGGDFFLSCLAMMLLAAAGNIINDYFDQKVDRINRPDKVIVGKTVKRRVAMVLHQVLNITAALIGVYLSWKTRMWMGVLTPVLIATLLWWYSPVLKKKAFIGNLAVALCVAAVPIWAGYFEIHLLNRYYGDMLPDPAIFTTQLWSAIGAYALFAFLLTLAREGQKDMEDLEGDTEGGYKTLPVLFGNAWVKKYVLTILMLVMLLVGVMVLVFFRGADNLLIIAGLSMVMVIFPIAITAIKTSGATTRKQFHAASTWSKISMAGGILFTLVIRFLVFDPT